MAQKTNLNLPKKRTITVPASLLKRFASYAIDLSIINILLWPLRNLFVDFIPKGENISKMIEYISSNPNVTSMMIFYSVITGIVMISYFTYFEYRSQITPGKYLLKLKMIPDDKKNKLKFWNYLISNITFIPIFPFVLLFIIDPIHMIFSKKNQRFMEKITNILVIENYEVY